MRNSSEAFFSRGEVVFQCRSSCKRSTIAFNTKRTCDKKLFHTSFWHKRRSVLKEWGDEDLSQASNGKQECPFWFCKTSPALQDWWRFSGFSLAARDKAKARKELRKIRLLSIISTNLFAHIFPISR